MKSWLFLPNTAILLLVLPSCTEYRQTLRKHVVFSPKNIQTSLDTTAAIERPSAITVWIHGTRLFYVAGNLSNFQFSKPGLHLARDYAPQYHLYQVGKTLIESAPHLFSSDSFYIFGWSGKLDFNAREQAAERLYKELSVVIEQYEQKYNAQPVVRIITHSHGGNVALNLARVTPKKESFHIDELILLACPVQDHTASLIRSSIFKKIFCIYSQLDICQILDPQGFYKNGTKSSSWLSGRYFPEQENLEQVKIKMNGRSIFHSEFVFPRFLAFLAEIIGTMDHWHKEIPQDKPFAKFIKMLHVRTNGKPFKFKHSHSNKLALA
jgi:hypothetical protein